MARGPVLIVAGVIAALAVSAAFSAPSTKTKVFEAKVPVGIPLYLQLRGPPSAVAARGPILLNAPRNQFGGFRAVPKAEGPKDCTYVVEVPKTTARFQYVGQTATLTVYGSSIFAPELCRQLRNVFALAG
jgi:hypothetical protein